MSKRRGLTRSWGVTQRWQGGGGRKVGVNPLSSLPSRAAIGKENAQAIEKLLAEHGEPFERGRLDAVSAEPSFSLPVPPSPSGASARDASVPARGVGGLAPP